MKTETRNLSWRIQKIPFEVTRVRGLVAFIPALGVVGFISGFALLWFSRRGSPGIRSVATTMFFTGLILSALGIWLVARKKRHGWKIVEARCVDRELKQVPIPRGGWAWEWRIVCEYENDGTAYRVTPVVGWSKHAKETKALRYLEKRVAADNCCRLAVNPKLPYQAELIGGRSVGELLLWWPHT